MKKLLFLIICLFLFICNINASTNIRIKDVSVYDKTDTIDINNYTYSGLNINADLFFNEVNDFVKFKITLINSDNEDYELSDIKSNYTSEYILLTYEYENNNRIFKANSEKTIFVTFKNTKEATNTVNLNDTPIVLTIPLSNDNSIINPKTGYQNSYIIILSLLVIGIITYSFVNKKKTLLIFAICLLLTNIYVVEALKTINVDINLNITMDSPNSAKAKLKPGPEIEKHMFDVANIPYDTYLEPSCVNENPTETDDDPIPNDYYTCLNNILKYERSETIPNEYKTNENIISTEDSDIPVYMWYDSSSKTIYWYSEAKIVYLNENATQTFGFLEFVTNLDLSHFRTKYTTDMSGLFEWDASLESIDVSMFDTSNVTDMGEMFALMKNLKSIDLSNFDTSNVINMDGLFIGNMSLKTLDLSNFDTSKVENFSDVFDFCNSLEELDISSFRVNTFINVFPNHSSPNSKKILKRIKTPAYIENNLGIFLNYVFTDGTNYYDVLDNTTPTSTWITAVEENLISFEISCGFGVNICSPNNFVILYAREGMTWGEWLNSNFNSIKNISFVSDDVKCTQSND